MKYRAQVIVSIDGQTPAAHYLDVGEYLLGRSNICDIPVPSIDVSQQHARLVVGQNELSLEDLGSTNGVYVEEKRLESPVILRPPQRIRLGNTWVEIRFATPDNHSDQPAHSISSPEYLTVKKYRLGRVVDHGGMGEIIEATDDRLGRVVALKRMLSGKTVSQELRSRFEREAKVLSQLEHPNIVAIHDLDVDNQGQPFYTMKLVKGTTLHQVLEAVKAGQTDAIAQYPLPLLLTVFQKVCDAVSFAHSKGVIHRDLKPANIMLGSFGEVLVMDWGLAKVIMPTIEVGGGEDEITQTEAPEADRALGTLAGQILGTPNFMAPEQAEGLVDAIDARTDVFTLGGILYNILTLRPPVTGSTATEAIEKIKSGRIPSPTIYNRAVRVPSQAKDAPVGATVDLAHCPGGIIPEALSAVAMRALAIAPENRYQSVADLQKDIAAYQGGFATAAEQAGAWRLMCLALKRRKAEFSLAAAALVILAMVGAFSFWRITTTLVEMRKSAPAHYEKAQALLQAGKFEEALERADYAATLAPANPDYRFLKGCLLQTLLRLRESRVEFAQIVRQDRKQDRARQNVELCDRLLALNHGAPTLSQPVIEQLYQALQAQGRISEALQVLSQLGDAKQRQFSRWQDNLKQAGISGKLERNDDGTLVLDIQASPINDLTPLRGLPLNRLSLHGCTNVTDLSPLIGMKLTYLDLWDCNVSDLTPLQGMPLKALFFGSGPVTNLAPLRGLPLVEISFYTTKVADFSPLRGMPLARFDLINDDQLTDLSALQGMPLTWLRLGLCPRLTNVSALTGMKLEFLALSGPIRELGMLQGMPLRYLCLLWTRISDLRFVEGMPLRELMIVDAQELRDISALRELPLTNLVLQVVPGLKDISALRDLPLDQLRIQNTAVSDLSPLKGMALRSLNLCQAPVKDLSPLGSLTHLQFLEVSDCQAVQDVAALRGLPLRGLMLHGCIRLRNLNPLVECRQLEKLILPPYARDLAALRQELTQLKLISYAYPDYDLDPIPRNKAPEAFWRTNNSAQGR